MEQGTACGGDKAGTPRSARSATGAELTQTRPHRGQGGAPRPRARWAALPWLRSPRVLGPALAGGALLAALLAYAGVGPVLRRAAQFQPASLLLLGVLML